METKEKDRRSGPLPKYVLADIDGSKSSPDFAQQLARTVFGRGYIVEHASLGDRFRKRTPSRIRAWRAPA